MNPILSAVSSYHRSASLKRMERVRSPWINALFNKCFIWTFFHHRKRWYKPVISNKNTVKNTIHYRYKSRLNLKLPKNIYSDKKFIHVICVVPHLILQKKSLKVLILKILSVSQTHSSLGKSFHSFAAAYSNIDWPIAVFYLGR